MTKIQPHPLGRVSRLFIRYSERTCRCGCLQFVGERIVVTRVAVVQETPDGTEEFYGARREFLFSRAATLDSLLSAGNLPQPHRGLVVAQPSWRFLDVRLEVKDRVAVALQSVLGQF